jgi:hypothetical protein
MKQETKSFSSILRELQFEKPIPQKKEQVDDDFFSILDKTELQILMHRDAHFSGKFPIMIQYYEKEGIGSHEEFNLELIINLEHVEKEYKQNLSSLYLTGADMERVARAKQAYLKLSDLFEIENPKSKHPQLIADLILSEEEGQEEAIKEVVKEGKEITASLTSLLKSDLFLDPLFPGYGLAPSLAAHCLGKIGYKNSVIPLFESIGQGTADFDETIISALSSIGQESKQFIIERIKSRPITEDNIRAAMTASSFGESPEIASLCFEELQKEDSLRNLSLCSYLVLSCYELRGEKERLLFTSFVNNPSFPNSLKEEGKSIIKSWK